MQPETILVTGANGQIGTVLTEALRAMHGKDHVIATDIKRPDIDTGPFEMLDILNTQRITELLALSPILAMAFSFI